MNVWLQIFLWLVVLKCAEPQQQTISQTAATLSQARCCLAATSSGELVFFGGGSVTFSNTIAQVDIYNVASGSWTTSNLSVARRNLVATSSGNLVFFAGGWDGSSTSYNLVDIYNTLDGSWSTGNLSQSRYDLAATSVGNLALFGGGSGPSNVVDIYNVTNNMWTTATLSQARSSLAATSVASQYALFAGGYDGLTTSSNVVDIYDSWNEIWSTATLSQGRELLAATSVGSLAFFGGGQTTSGNSTSIVDIFNSTSQTWSTATLSQSRYYLAAASIGDIVAFGGGTPDNFNSLSIVDMYNVTSGIWFNATLSQPHYELAATSSTNKIFFGGGSNTYETVKTVDIFDIPVVVIQSPITMPTSTPTTSSSLIGVTVVLVVNLAVLVAAVGIILVLIIKRRRRKPQRTEMTNANKDQMISELAQSSGSVLQIPYTEIVIDKELGKGRHGKVYLGKWHNRLVALKFYVLPRNPKDYFLNEWKILIELPVHPNVVQIYGISLDGPESVLVMEYCAGGSLNKMLFNLGFPISKKEEMKLIRGIAAGMLHLHKYNVVHRDLAARNILLTASGDPKISDFGMSQMLEGEQGKTYSTFEPLRWMAPESIGERKYSKQSDVWSFGIVVWEIVARREPHTNLDPVDVGVLIRDQGMTPEIPSSCPPLLRDLMLMCWNRDPNQRPTFEVICKLLEPS